MDEFIYREFHGSLNDAERAMLWSWRQASAANDARYLEMVRFLSDVRTVASREFTPTVPTLEQLPRVVSRVSPWRASDQRRRFAGAALVLAACLTLVLIAMWRGPNFTGQAPSLGSGEISLGSGEIVTGATERTTVKLGDGTIVRLAPSSRLRISGVPNSREVWLDGRAYFAVTKQSGTPFRVRTHAGDAVVLGTRFDLRAHHNDLQLLVVEGAVNVAAAGTTVDVTASQLASVSEAEGAVQTTVDETYMAAELSWMGDFLVFENTPLSQAARELSAHFGVTFEVLDTTLARQTVRGSFTEESLDEVVGVVCRAVSAHCSIGPSKVTIAP
ncbi:MAG: DUF4974 domain-containing protein [Gemmatimonas sp.]|nr:DUF4974 domain-containing protein [Gemmatimonas sp.]